jgi:hypothetical protein
MASAAAYESYQWHGQLVALEDGAITVKSRIVSRDGLAELDSLTAGEEILVNWSGFEDRANGIRSVKRTRPLWDEGFRLPATFVAADTATQYVTFTVATPDGSLAAVGSLEPGTWVTVTSRHRPTGETEAVVMVDAFDTTRQARRYAWQGDLLSFDKTAAAVEVSAAVEDHVVRYVDRFNKGDEVVLIWAPSSDEDVAAIRYLEPREGSILDHGYVLPVEFAGADTAQGRITFSVRVPPSTLTSWAALQPGTAVRVTSLFEQRGDTAAILTVESSDEQGS